MEAPYGAYEDERLDKWLLSKLDKLKGGSQRYAD